MLVIHSVQFSLFDFFCAKSLGKKKKKRKEKEKHIKQTSNKMKMNKTLEECFETNNKTQPKWSPLLIIIQLLVLLRPVSTITSIQKTDWQTMAVDKKSSLEH